MATKTTPTKSTPAPSQDAIKLLTADHKEVKRMFEQYQKLADGNGSASDRKALAEKICKMLIVHTTIEEEIFYPAAREADVEADLLNEAEVEHAGAKDLIAQIKAMSADEELYDAKVKVLGESIDHHVEEEEDEMFPACRKADMDLAELGLELADRKAEISAQLDPSGS